MPRIRTIKPDYWKSEKLASRLPGGDGREARHLFIGLWNFAEDHGVARANPNYLRAELYPYDNDVTTADVERWLGMLEAGHFIVRFERDGASYLWIRGFSDHQRIDKPSKKLTFPSPTEEEKGAVRERSQSQARALPEHSTNAPGAFPVGSGSGSGSGSGLGREEEAEGSAREARESPPPEKRKGVLVYEEPTSDPESWGPDEFFSWAQSVRQDSGCIGEPRPRDLSGWYSDAVMAIGGDVPMLQEAFYRFGQDKFWESKDPPFPFAGFMSQWRKYVPRREVEHDARA